MVQVAIIDTLMGEEKDNINNIYHYIVKNDRICKKKSRFKSRKIINHGQICCEIFKSYAIPGKYKLHCIEIFRKKQNTTTVDNLLVSLEWCIENNIDLVCMSVGSRVYCDCEKLFTVMSKIEELGNIVVAAINNSNTLTFPASFKYAVGVVCDKYQNLEPEKFIYLNADVRGINIISSCCFKEVERKLGIKIEPFNSYATPYIAARILNLMVEGKKSHAEILKLLKENASFVLDSERLVEIKYAFKENFIIGICENTHITYENVKRIIRFLNYRNIYTIGAGQRMSENPYFVSYNNKGNNALFQTLNEIAYFLNPQIIIVMLNKEEFYDINNTHTDDFDIMIYEDKATMVVKRLSVQKRYKFLQIIRKIIISEEGEEYLSI